MRQTVWVITSVLPEEHPDRDEYSANGLTIFDLTKEGAIELWQANIRDPEFKDYKWFARHGEVSIAANSDPRSIDMAVNEALLGVGVIPIDGEPPTWGQPFDLPPIGS